MSLSSINQEVTRALIAQYGFKESGEWLRQGKCPNCSHKELWTHSQTPHTIKCARLNHCGFTSTSKELFPHLFQDFSKRFVSPTNPNAAADAYLQYARGIDIAKIKDWYTQDKFWAPGADKGSATVRFTIDEGVYMERLVDVININNDGEITTRKANFIGAHKGLWWAPPSFTPDINKPIYIVEGIVDAISLIQCGLQAVASLSCVNYPYKSLENLPEAKKHKWVWALDNDKAGREFAHKHHNKMQEDGYNVAVALAPQPEGANRHKKDWNDLLLSGDLSADKIQSTMKYARHLGDLLTAKSANHKGALIFIHKKFGRFCFDFENQLYWWEYKEKDGDKIFAGEKPNRDNSETIELLAGGNFATRIANCHPVCLYHEASLINDEFNRYYFRINKPNGQHINAAFTGSQLAAATEFKKRLLGVSTGSMWLGKGPELDSYLLTTLHNLPSVEVFDAAGYSTKHDAYIYPTMGIKNGRVFKANDQDFIEMGKITVKTAANINMVLSDNIVDPNWLKWIEQAYGDKGIVALAYWIGALFAEQIRDKHKSYPFLELIGEPGSGKSTILEYFWKLFGRDDYEGFDPSKSSLAARTRTFAQASNLPIVLIESDRDDDTKKFQWDELKTAYNGRAIRSRGVKTGGNEVYEPPFRGALVISQNARVDASEAVMQRVVGIEFTKQNHTPESIATALKIEAITAEQVSGVLVTTLKKTEEILKVFFSAFNIHKKNIADSGVVIDRLCKNHAQIAAFVEVLHTFHGLTAERKNSALQYINTIAKERQEIVGNDSPILIEFWELFDYLNRNEKLNHSNDEKYIAINLNQVYEAANSAKQNLPNIRDLKRALRGSRRHQFVDHQTLWSKSNGDEYIQRQLRCWVFKA